MDAGAHISIGGFEERIVQTVDGLITVEGPHYPKPHRWYGQCTMKDGLVVKIV